MATNDPRELFAIRTWRRLFVAMAVLLAVTIWIVFR
jgi:hypothetical protein